MIKKFLPLLFSLAMASTVPAQAGNVANCVPKGVSQLEKSQKDDPAGWRDLLAEADRIPNARGIIWKIEKDGSAPSFLFGTMHFSDPRIMKMPEAASIAYEEAETVVIETTDLLDPKFMLRLKVEHPEYLNFTDGTTLLSHLPADRIADVESKLAKRGYVLDAMAKLKPWMIYTSMVIPNCEAKRLAAGKPPLDLWLAKTALDDGKQVKGLESAAEQFAALNSIPLEIHMRSLMAMADNSDKIDDAVETMIDLYLRQDIGLIELATRKSLPDDLSNEEYAKYMDALVATRNHRMADRSIPFLEQGNAFIAVGALHLGGEQGLVELLRSKGYRVSRL